MLTLSKEQKRTLLNRSLLSVFSIIANIRSVSDKVIIGFCSPLPDCALHLANKMDSLLESVDVIDADKLDDLVLTEKAIADSKCNLVIVCGFAVRSLPSVLTVVIPTPSYDVFLRCTSPDELTTLMDYLKVEPKLDGKFLTHQEYISYVISMNELLSTPDTDAYVVPMDFPDYIQDGWS